MGFTHIQGASNSATGTFSVSVTLSSPPTLGNVVCVSIGMASNNNSVYSNVLVQDSNGNVYTLVSGSGYSGVSFTFVGLAYLYPAPANADATITFSFSASTVENPLIFADEFVVPPVGSGVFSFDTSSREDYQSSSTSSITLPSLTPSSPNELFYAGFTQYTAGGGTGVQPTSNGTFSGWTGSAGIPIATCRAMAEYQLSASVTQNVAFDLGALATEYSAMAMAFSFIPYPIDVSVEGDQWLGGDEY